MLNIDSILKGKNSKYFFGEKSDNAISENECFKNEKDKKFNIKKKSNNSKIISKASSKKTLNTLLNNKIISKEQSILLCFKNINQELFNSGNLLDIKKI